MFRLPIIIGLLLFPIITFSQKKTFDVGDIIKISVDLYDTSGTKVAVPITDGSYNLVYFYNWIGTPKETKDSIKKMEAIISRFVTKYKTNDLKVIVISFDEGENYKNWLSTLKKKKPFKVEANRIVNYYNTNDYRSVVKQMNKLFDKVSLIGPDGKLIQESNSIATFLKQIPPDPIASSKNLKGKLLKDSSGIKIPLINTIVSMFNTLKNDTLAKTRTDAYGDFEIPLPDDEKSTYQLRVDPRFKNIRSVTLVSQEGKEIANFTKTNKGFVYNLLKADIITLMDPPMEEDMNMKVTNFAAGKAELKIIENISYGLGKFTVEKNAEEALARVVKIMQEHPTAKLEIISHTDAQGEDAANLTLSEKRSNSVLEYIASKGIDKSRLKAIGKGESEIRNRCTNGVECSDKEHQYNRRTEFNFRKN
jgi:outer membrane protein OmpA-like peptidoglycan-associated protein